MEYTLREIAEIKAKAHAVLDAEFYRAQEENKIEEFMEKYCVVYEEEWMPVEKNRSKIMVFGNLSGNVSDYYLTAKKLGISKENIEFKSDYDELKRYDVSNFKNSSSYSDIIVGPMPHKTTGMGDTSSFVAEMKNNPGEYPKVTEALVNGKLKITKTSFENALRRTRYYNKIILEE